jgi:hypothetical protein
MQKVEGSSPFTRSNLPSRGEAEDRSHVLCRLPFVVVKGTCAEAA